MSPRQTKNRRSLTLLLATAISLLGLAMSAEAQEWRATKIPFDETVTGLSFPTSDIGYFVTSGGKYGITKNGGKYWQVYRFLDPFSMEDVYFKSKDTGLAVGRNGMILRTVDGAVNWEDWGPVDSTIWFTSGIFVNDTVALATGLKPGTNMEGVLYRSVDGGKKWELVDITGMGFGELFKAEGVPVCFQSFGKLNYSTDQGKTWQSLSTVGGKPGRATAFYNKTAIICGNDAMLAFSQDRGKTWAQSTTEGGANLTTVILVNDSLGYLGGTGGHVMFTEDGGKSWKKEKPLPEMVDVAKIAVAGDRLIVACAGGFIFNKPLPKR
ncbi:MAG: YCF48-related protein [candidate division Zixibacteria bacterium]|nr:YCF48-related protein [candidate division Zixibacteria bacterium]